MTDSSSPNSPLRRWASRLGLPGARGRRPGRDLAAVGDRHAGGAGGALARPGRRPLRPARAAGAAARPRRGRAARAHRRGAWEELVEEIELPEGTAGSQLGARARAAGRPPARRAAAQGADAAGAAPRRAARRRRQLERRAGTRPPDRLGAGAAHRADARGWRSCPAPAVSLRAARGRPRPAAPPSRSSWRCAATSPAAAASPPPLREVRAAAGRRGAAQGPAGRLRLPRPRAPRAADPLPGARRSMTPALTGASTPRGRSRSRPARRGSRARSRGSRSRRCARSGWSRTAGGRRGRCGATTSSWCWSTGATWSSSADRRRALVPAAGLSGRPRSLT